MNEMMYYDLKDASGIAPGLALQVSRELGRRIVADHYKENTLIEDEVKLSQRFGVSKSVIREGVKLLVSKGLRGLRDRREIPEIPGLWVRRDLRVRTDRLMFMTKALFSLHSTTSRPTSQRTQPTLRRWTRWTNCRALRPRWRSTTTDGAALTRS